MAIAQTIDKLESLGACQDARKLAEAAYAASASADARKLADASAASATVYVQ